MKKAFYPVLALVFLLPACKKTEDNGGGSGSSAQLIPASAGWQRVCSVPYLNTVSGFPGENSMTPYDLTMVGNDLALLYSDDYSMAGGDRHTIMKLMLSSGTVAAKSKAIILNYDRGDNAVQIHRFIPGSFNTISAKFQNNECLLYDEAGGPNAGQNFGSINALPTLRWYGDGSIVAGMNDGPHSSAAWSYKYPATGSFKYIINVWNGDSTANVLSSPMKLADGNIYDLVFSKRNGIMYFSVLKNVNEPRTGTAPNYEMVWRNTVPGLDAGKSYSVVTSDGQGDTQIILLAEQDYVNGNPTYVRLIAFRWQKGNSVLEKLYDVPVSSIDLAKKIMELTTNISFPNEVRLTPDGTAYFLNDYHSSQGPVTDYTALVLVNKAGIKEIGKIGRKDMEAVKRSQFSLHCCRYFNGAYYAVVHPVDEYDYNIYTPEFRIEVVKITP